LQLILEVISNTIVFIVKAAIRPWNRTAKATFEHYEIGGLVKLYKQYAHDLVMRFHELSSFKFLSRSGLPMRVKIKIT
jgi:hypothetical protein